MALHFHNYPPSGFNVVVGAFDDAGWMEEKVRWGPWDEKKERIPKAEEGPSLAETIAGGTNLPVAEASELAGSALQEWRKRGGEEEGRGDAIKGLALVTTIGAGVLLTVAAVITAVVFAVILVTNIL